MSVHSPSSGYLQQLKMHIRAWSQPPPCVYLLQVSLMHTPLDYSNICQGFHKGKRSGPGPLSDWDGISHAIFKSSLFILVPRCCILGVAAFFKGCSEDQGFWENCKTPGIRHKGPAKYQDRLANTSSQLIATAKSSVSRDVLGYVLCKLKNKL